MRCLTLPKRMPMHIVQRIQSAFKRRSKRERRKMIALARSSAPASPVLALVERHPWLGLEKFTDKNALKAAAVVRNLA